MDVSLSAYCRLIDGNYNGTGILLIPIDVNLSNMGIVMIKNKPQPPRLHTKGTQRREEEIQILSLKLCVLCTSAVQLFFINAIVARSR